MKKLHLILPLLISLQLVSAQDKNIPRVGLKWAPTGLFLGSLSLQGEYNFGKSSLTAKIGIPVSTSHQFSFEDKDANFSLKATSFLAGYRTYLSKKHMHGLYLEPYFKYVHHESEGTGTAQLTGETARMDFSNTYNGVGIGAQLGAQFLVGRHFVIDIFFLGPELNSAKNNFRAVETSNQIPWTQIQANEAVNDIRDFVDQFPFIRHKVQVAVDPNHKTVTADFKGWLPGFRAGVSLGFVF